MSDEVRFRLMDADPTSRSDPLVFIYEPDLENKILRVVLREPGWTVQVEDRADRAPNNP